MLCDVKSKKNKDDAVLFSGFCFFSFFFFYFFNLKKLEKDKFEIRAGSTREATN